MPNKKQKVTQKQWQALPLLAAGKSGAEAAATVGVSPSTVSTWMNHDTVFRRELAKQRRQVLKTVRSELIGCAMTAVETIREVMESGESESARLRASEFVLRTLDVNAGNGRTGTDSERDRDGETSFDLNKILEGLGINEERE